MQIVIFSITLLLQLMLTTNKINIGRNVCQVLQLKL